MFMSQRNLNRIVGLVRGKTVTDLIADKVILEAKRMLIYSRLTIAKMRNSDDSQCGSPGSCQPSCCRRYSF